MRLKGKKFREKISDLERRGRKKNGVIASRSLKVLYKHFFSSSQQNAISNQERAYGILSGFFMGKPFFLRLKEIGYSKLLPFIIKLG
jgi:hypothetical protein